jgi:hypothetical protein
VERVGEGDERANGKGAVEEWEERGTEDRNGCRERMYNELC